jgi:Domain of unknown function (DUF4279)
MRSVSWLTLGMETSATYRVHGGPELTAAAVSQALDLVPTTVIEHGQHRSSAQRAATVSGWFLSTGSSPQDGVELSEQLDKLLTMLEPRTEELWQLFRTGYQFDWFCYVGSHATEHALEIRRETMQRLLAIPGELLLDLYGDGTDD